MDTLEALGLLGQVDPPDLAVLDRTSEALLRAAADEIQSPNHAIHETTGAFGRCPDRRCPDRGPRRSWRPDWPFPICGRRCSQAGGDERILATSTPGARGRPVLLPGKHRTAVVYDATA